MNDSERLLGQKLDSQTVDQTQDRSAPETPGDGPTGPYVPNGALPAPDWAELGSRLVDVEFLAAGGMGEVFLATDPRLNARIIVKVIGTMLARSEDSIKRFLWEAQVTARLNHPGVPAVHGVGKTSDGRPCYAMRFISGVEMNEALATKKPWVDLAHTRRMLNHFVAVCQVVAYAHGQGVIHRDLKPQNIRLGEFGETVVLDWGLAKSHGQGPPTVDEQGTVLGTRKYMPPEQAEGRQHDVDERSDVFALGKILLDIVATNGPGPLRSIVARATAAGSADRYQSVRALADDVQRWLADEKVTVHRDSLGVRLARRLRKNPVWVTGFAVAIVGLTITVVAVAVEQRQTAHQRDLAQENEGKAKKERDEKEVERQRAVSAREQTRQALRSFLEDDVVRLFERTAKVTEAEFAFLDQLAERFRAYGQGDFTDETRRTVYRGLFRIAVIFARFNQNQRAEKLYRDVIVRIDQLLYSSPGDSLLIKSRADTQANLAHLLGQTSPKEASSLFQQSLATLQRLRQDHPTNPEVVSQLSLKSNNYAEFLSRTGQIDQARRKYLEAINFSQQFQTMSPANDEPKRFQGGIHYNLGNLLSEIDPPAASEHHRRSIEFRSNLLAKQPSDSVLQDNLAESYCALGLHLSHSNPEESLRLYQEALKIQDKLVQEFPSNVGYCQHRSHTMHNLGVLHSDQGRTTEAGEVYERSVKLMRDLAERNAESPIFQNELAVSLYHLGQHYFELKNWKKARELAEETVFLCERTGLSKSKIDKHRLHYALTLRLLAGAHRGLGDYQQAIQVSDRLAKFPNDVGTECHDPAAILASCIPLVEKDSRRTDTTAYVEDLRKRSMSFLRQAYNAGAYDDADLLDELRTVKDFDPIRRDPEFKQLLKQIAERKAR